MDIGSGVTNRPQGQALRRHQACHQCRKKKMKCDAVRPACRNCVKAHDFRAERAANKNEPYNEPIVCTYDGDDLENDQVSPSADLSMEGSINGRDNHYLRSPESSTMRSQASDTISSGSNPSPSMRHDIFPSINQTRGPFGDAFSSPDHPFASIQDPFQLGHVDDSSPMSSGSHSILSTGYPSGLPEPILLEHLVKVFFDSVPHARRLLHRPTFMHSLRLQANNSLFPSSGLLHSICALAAMYSPAADLSMISMPGVRTSYDVFKPLEEVLRETLDGMKPTFAMEQAILGRSAVEIDIRTGTKLPEAILGMLILSFYYSANAQYIDLWTCTGVVLRYAPLLGLNQSLNKAPTGGVVRDTSHLFGMESQVILAEQRRNIFWAAWMLDRQTASMTSYTGALDEMNIGQELPCTLEDFERGIYVAGMRQRLWDVDLYTNHPAQITDGFTLYVKAMLLMSRASNFNLRLEMKRQSDVNNQRITPEQAFRPGPVMGNVDFPNTQYDQMLNPHSSGGILAMPEFQTLDRSIQAFWESIPRRFRSFIKQEQVDTLGIFMNDHGMSNLVPTLSVDYEVYMIELVAATALIILHNPHADIHNPQDRSREAILRAARHIATSVHSLLNMSFDVHLLPSGTIANWATAAGVLSRFYCAALRNQDSVELANLKVDIDILRTALALQGQKRQIANDLSGNVKIMITNIERAFGTPPV